MKRVVKFFKRLFVVFAVFALLASLCVFVFEDDLIKLFKKEASKRLNTTVDTKIQVSFWKTFPNVSIEMQRPVILDAVKGSKDTLLVADELFLSFDVMKLIKKEFVINEIHLENGHLYLKVDEEGNNNYTILKSKTQDSSSASLSLALDKVTLENVGVHYINQSVLNNHNVQVHQAEADLVLNDSLVQITLLGEMFAKHIRVNKNDYVFDKELKLDVGCTYKFTQKSFHLFPSIVAINGAEFNLKGDVYNRKRFVDLEFEAKKNDVKNIVSLLPSHVSDALSHYESEGQINFSGQIKGKYGKKVSPELKIMFGFEDASIYHPETGKRVKHLYMRGEYGNGSKRTNTTSYVKIFGLKGEIDDNKFDANVRVDNFESPYLTLELKAKAKIASLLEFYPIEGLLIKRGQIGLDLDFKGQLKHLKKGDFLDKVYSKGSVTLADCDFRTRKDKLTYSNFNGECLFNNNSLGITQLSGKIGNSDFKTSGLFKNFFSYLLLDNQKIDIQADLVSDFIDLDELLAVSESEQKAVVNEELKYEFSLDKRLKASCSINVKKMKFRELKGDDIAKNLNGEFFINKGKIRYSNVRGQLAKGTLEMSGEIDASQENNVTVYNYGKIKDLDVSQVFRVLENFGQEFLTDKNLEGTLSATLSTKLPFDKHLKLDLARLESTLNATIKNGELKDFDQMVEMGKVLDKYKLTKYLKSKDLHHVKFDEMSNTIFIKDEVVTIPQMTLGTSASSDITLNGMHQFDNEFDYKISFPLVNYKRQGRKIDKGIRTKDESDNLYVYVRIVGNPDDYKIDYDEKAILKSVAKQINPISSIKQMIQKDTLQEASSIINIDEDVDSTEVMYLDDW